MAVRNYSSTAARTTLSAGVTAATTTLTVAATTGFPPAPFILAVNAGAAAQELVLVTNVAGTNLTVTRGYDSTVASAHDAGAVVEHSHAAIDFREANTHVNATTGIHGTTGALVGTSDTQTLTNKTLALGSNTVSGTRAQFNTALTDDDFATLAGTETLTNKTLSLSSNTLSGTKAQFNAALTDSDFATVDGTETLTNKTLTAPVASGSLTSFGGTWTAFTPTITNWGVGNGTLLGRFEQRGKSVKFRIEFTVGSTTTLSGILNFALPVAANFSAGVMDAFPPVGWASLRDVSAPAQRQWMGVLSSTTTVIVADDSLTPVQPTVPWSWATGDIIVINGTYEAA